ncbi:uncharacterized protein LOC123264967 [Cotesia glomerata]|uniref:Uncharacterized protein n=1 Tax=Cotesia glomerata TaxID=32391 RepID=A0AAV7IJW6_COTGL|nr:uncharacterized protein LOC123264967 [Cotesia glomerata]KAH0561725.1 hypothetical protein KQX54_019035 [Cotesia glomerata]
MAQGKMKVKTKLPDNAKAKQGNKKKPAVQRRGNAPIKAKKAKLLEAHKLKQMITKTVNKAAESELRERALDGKMSLVKKNPAVKK